VSHPPLINIISAVQTITSHPGLGCGKGAGKHQANAAVQGKHKRGAKLLMDNSGVARLVDKSGKYWTVRSCIKGKLLVRLLHATNKRSFLSLSSLFASLGWVFLLSLNKCCVRVCVCALSSGGERAAARGAAPGDGRAHRGGLPGHHHAPPRRREEIAEASAVAGGVPRSPGRRLMTSQLRRRRNKYGPYKCGYSKLLHELDDFSFRGYG
jgi:hypothetical protein